MTTEDTGGIVGLDAMLAATPLLARIPAPSLAAAAGMGPRTREWIRGDVEAEQREQLRASRARLWAETLRTWPDDDFTGAALGSLTHGQKRGDVRAWVEDPHARILILVGETGRGKTHTQFAIGNHYAAQGLYVVAVSHKRYLDALEPDGNDEPDYVLRRRMAHADVLLVDGFGDEMDPTRPASEFRARETSDLVSMRLRRGKRTVISTNLKSEHLGVMFGDRVISRLKQGSTPLLVEGEDRRAQGAKW